MDQAMANGQLTGYLFCIGRISAGIHCTWQILENRSFICRDRLRLHGLLHTSAVPASVAPPGMGEVVEVCVDSVDVARGRLALRLRGSAATGGASGGGGSMFGRSGGSQPPLPGPGKRSQNRSRPWKAGARNSSVVNRVSCHHVALVSHRCGTHTAALPG